MKICAPKESSQEASGEKQETQAVQSGWQEEKVRGGKGIIAQKKQSIAASIRGFIPATYKGPEALWQSTLEEESGVG